MNEYSPIGRDDGHTLAGEAGLAWSREVEPEAAVGRLFSSGACDALFAAILIDDEIDPDLRLPDTIQIDHERDALIACFGLCRQLWADGFDRAALIGLARTLVRNGDLEAADRVRFKHVRAKFKHVRYAHALYGARHAYPVALDRFTITMGQAQDAYRNRRRIAATGRAALLRLLLTAPAVRRLVAETERLVPTTPAAFRALLLSDYAKLGALIARPTVTGHQFHQSRKIVGRQVSFWDTLRTLAPTEDRYRLSRWLSAINGAMGTLHDELIEKRARDRASYAAAFVLPDDIRARIAALLERAPA